MLMTRGIETHLLNYSSLIIPFASWVSQLLFWPFILKIDVIIFSGWKVHEGWHGGGVGGELAVTKKPGATCIYLRVHVAGRFVSACRLYEKRKIPWNGWWLGHCCIRESPGVNLFRLHGFTFLPSLTSLPPTAIPTGSLLFEHSFIQSSHLSSSYCLHRTAPGAVEEIRGKWNTDSPSIF